MNVFNELPLEKVLPHLKGTWKVVKPLWETLCPSLPFCKSLFFLFCLVLFSFFFFFNKRVIFLPLGGNERCLKLQVKIAGLERHWRLKLISLGNYKCNLSHAALSFSLFQNHHAASETTPCRLLFWLTKLWKLIGVKKMIKAPDVGATSSVLFLQSHSASDDVHVREKSVCWKVFIPRKKTGAPSYFIIVRVCRSDFGWGIPGNCWRGCRRTTQLPAFPLSVFRLHRQGCQNEKMSIEQ